MKAKVVNQYGDIMISDEAIATVAGSAAVECIGVVGMASVGVKDGIVRLLKKESLRQGIEVGIDEENKISLKLHIIVAYGVSIHAVGENLTENVRYKVESMTGMEIKDIQIFVEGVKPID